MWKVGIYLVLISIINIGGFTNYLGELSISCSAFAGEDKPQTNKPALGPPEAEKGTEAEKSTSSDGTKERLETKSSDISKETPQRSREGIEEGAKGSSAPSTSGAAQTPGQPKADTARDFLRLAEPKSLTEKKQPPKNVPWGGYWSAIYRNSPDEEEEPGGLETRLPKPGTVKPAEKPLSLAEYMDVDFARFASGSYASDYGGRYVKFRCRFASLAPEGMRLNDFPPPQFLNFIVVGPGSSMENLTVVARAELGDKIFRMESGKEIPLYGL
ncbi:MAG TPA: hypothetical protein ACFYEM_09795, partial [Candidatus Hypogeohydataceae bacterium YC40]